MPEKEKATSEAVPGPVPDAVAFQVLGPFGARDGQGRALGLKGPRHRAVLARLIVARRRTVPVSWLVDDLWDEPPPTAVGTIRTFVGALRKALEPGRAKRAPARLLVTAGPGYALLAAPDAVDAWRFETAVRDAGRLLDGRGPVPVAALAALDDALALWHGPAYAEWADADWARAEVTRLDGLRLLAVERRARLALAVGRAAEAVLDLESHAEAHPWREEAWELLALALYRAGRQGDALAVLRRARANLAGELGVDPGEGLRRAEAEILAQAAPGPGDGRPGAAPGTAALRGRDGAVADVRNGPSAGVRGAAVSGVGDGAAPGAPDVLSAAVPGVVAPVVRGAAAPLAVDAAVLLGRDAETAALEAAAHTALRTGRFTLALLSGEAGAGKTALAGDLAGRLGAAGWTAAWGRVPEGAAVPAGWPWTEALTELGLPAREFTPDGPGGGDPVALRLRRRRWVGERLASLAARGRPLLLVLDDLHWADEESLDLLAGLATAPPAAPVLVVGTYRDTEVPPLLGEFLGRAARAEPVRVRVGGLAEGPVRDLVAAVSGREVDAATARAVRRRSGGNPFFVRELARLYAADGAAALSGVPVGVRDLVRARLGTLPQEARTVLRLAAVVGAEADLDVLCALAGDEEVVLDAVEAAASAGFLTVPEEAAEQVRFAHALVHETVYDDLSRPRRARLHTAVAETLERLRPDAADALAHHYLSAGTRATAARAVTHASRAARRAEAAGAPHRARRLWGAALDAHDRGAAERDPAERLTLLMGLVRGLAVTGGLAEARRYRAEALAAAEADGDPALTARVIGAFDVPGIWARNDDEALSRRVVAAARRALDALPDDGTRARAVTRCRLLSGIAMETRGDTTGAGAAAARAAEALARDLAAGEGADGEHPERDAALLAYALNGRFLHTFHRPGLARERARIGVDLVALSARHGLVGFEVLGHLMLIQAHGARAEFARADAAAAAADRLAERYGLPLVGVFTSWYAALRAAVAGRTEEAEAAYRSAAGRLRGSGMSGMPEDELLRLALRCLGLVEDAEVPDAGQLLDVRLCLDARAAVRSGDAAAMADAYRRLLPAGDELAGAGSGLVALGPVAQELGDLAVALGRPAAAHYRTALAVAERAGAPHWAATARAALAAVRGCGGEL
ncbi:BTAD domain-containing putative transcriptional regulator [Streptomyces sp. AN091965]|uniref:BTAD domain-containing putative transcriptional regulator n=1 Tax=Streptomyces sp. AN091965 TaxID=2927803 RepID=UPI001F60F10F|nr:BTAD domain-containing putative transcriptional regulator [Streptomyces sp. AN091965]MCI3932138.1 AAA family ATPase [Streptomyces sp. AN091965]